MIAMGFKNDGNQLYELLESVDGNIASVLDLIDSQKWIIHFECNVDGTKNQSKLRE